MTHDEIEQVRFEYLMKRCKKGSVTLAEGISVEEASVIGENANVLKGIQSNYKKTRITFRNEK